jgi:GR25 family glycosyltransferase involved in LPS biosynthesis
MRIGIGVQTHSSVFINGDGGAALAIYHSIKKHNPGVTVFIIPFGTERWSDVSGVEYGDSPCDLYIDCTGARYKERHGSKNILLLRKPSLMSANERSVYPQLQGTFFPLNYDGVWVHSIEDKEAAEIIFKCPATVIPILWTPRIIEDYLRHFGPAPQITRWGNLADTTDKWTIRICENNISQMNPYLFPLFAVGRVPDLVPVDKIVLHNTEHFRTNEFFLSNIAANLADAVKERIIYGGRNRVVDWIYQPRTVILSHMRWRSWRPALLDALWAGIPVIHNSTWLRDCDPLFARYYYTNIAECEACFIQLQQDWEKKEGYFLEGEQQTGDAAQAAQAAQDSGRWTQQAAHSIDKPLPIQSLRIGFINMWDSFNPTANFIIDMLQAIIGPHVTGQHGSQGDIIVTGPFGAIPDTLQLPIIYYSGENTDDVADPRIILNLCHRNGPNCIRLPHWVTSINWFNTSQQGRNPVQLPLEWATTPRNSAARQFAAFVVSNPMNPIRNDAFHKLSTAGPVHSAGRLYNNVGGALWTQIAGGGGGERNKVEWLRNYTFCITYENSMGPGYVTEKLLHAKMAGCIPLYWGDSTVHEDFVEGSFIDCTAAPDKIAELAVADARIAATPPLDAIRITKWRSTFTEIAAYFTAKYIPTVYVTYTSARFIDSLHIWLGCVLRLPTAKVIVYLYHDAACEPLQAAWPTVTFLQFPQQTPAFPDYWEPSHYAAKLWLFNDVLQYIGPADRILFTDVGCAIRHLPYKYLSTAFRAGAAFYRDDEQKNRRWCSAAFCAALQVTEEELEAQQTISGFFAFTAAATPLIKEAYELSKQRHIIVGEKWILDGDIRGHRHDQSILSILALRHEYPWYSMAQDYTDKGERGHAFFAHRQRYPIKDVAAFIMATPTFVVNLDRRTDRWTEFEAWPHNTHYIRWAATDGRSPLTNEMIQLFRKNTYNWKKATIGCAYSHYRLWAQLATAREEMYIVLEDDARAAPSYRGWWLAAAANLPADFDILFLGGVLPANKAALPACLVQYNEFWSKIRKNDFFIRDAPYFHFCTYSYVISRRGAQKLMEYCKNGCNLPADHMLVNNYSWLNIYVASTLQIHCKQDEDPQYINAQLNDYTVVNSFDSDIWNTTDCWTAADWIARPICLRSAVEKEIADAILEGFIPLCLEKIDTRIPVVTVTDETKADAIRYFEENRNDARRYYDILIDTLKLMGFSATERRAAI